MAWMPLTPQSMPAEGELVLVTNGTDVTVAEFISDANGRRFEFVLLPADGVVTHWQTLPELPGA